MKKIFLITILNLISLQSIYSQYRDDYFYLTAGYNFTFPSAGDLNYIIDRYNETRNYLTKDMGNVNSLSGPAFSAGYGMSTGEGAWIFEGGITFNSSGEKSAEGVVQGVTAQRDLKVKTFLVNLGIGYLFNSGKLFEYGFGLFTDIGSLKIETRVYNQGDAIPDYTDITPEGNTSLLAFTPTGFFNINFTKSAALSVRPFYFGQIFKQDLTEVNKTLNPNTWIYDDSENFDSETLSSFGFELKAVISF